MKIFKFLALMLVMLIGISIFTSCSKDDDKDNPDENSIVGTWECNESEGSYYCIITLTFSKNGEWMERWDEDGYTGTAGGTYVVSGNKLTQIYDWDDDKHSPGERYTYTFRMPDNNTLVLIEADGDTEVYIRKK